MYLFTNKIWIFHSFCAIFLLQKRIDTIIIFPITGYSFLAYQRYSRNISFLKNLFLKRKITAMHHQNTNACWHKSRIKDVVIRVFAGTFFAFFTILSFRVGFAHLKGLNFAHPDLEVLRKTLSVFSIGLYGTMITILYVVRLRTSSKSASILPSVAAFLGAFVLFALLLIGPCETLPTWAQILSSILIVSGNVGAVVVLFWLGRSFSILPEGRKLIMNGPYAIVRHPLYLIEAFGTLGTIINFWSWPAVLLFSVQIAMQFKRMHYEEVVLKETFSDYADYALRTRRLIPWIY